MYLSLDEIIKKYNGQWVFMINCKEGEFGETIGGEVVLHSERRDKVIREMTRFKGEKSIIHLTYVGDIPEGVSVLL